MSDETGSTGRVDPGLETLVMLLHFQGVAADREQIRHRLGTDKIGASEILRCARDLGLKARSFRTGWSRLARTPLPAIASLRDGSFLVIAKATEDQVLVQVPGEPRPAFMTEAELLAIWDGGLILMTRRAGLSDITRRQTTGSAANNSGVWATRRTSSIRSNWYPRALPSFPARC